MHNSRTRDERAALQGARQKLRKPSWDAFGLFSVNYSACRRPPPPRLMIWFKLVACPTTTGVTIEKTLMKACLAVLVLWLSYLSFTRPRSQDQTFHVINAERINIRDKDGTLRAALSNADGFNEGQRKNVKFAGLMFYNEEGHETGGLTYSGRAKQDGQDADVTLAMDQYRQDQNVYLHHEEEKDATHTRLEDGLTLEARPDFTNVKEEYATYDKIDK